MHKTSPALDSTLFWDVNLETIDWESHARYVIERVLTRGALDDWREIVRFYGLERIGTEVVQMRFLDRKTLSFCSAVLDIPKEKFRCYNNSITTPSLRKLWDFWSPCYSDVFFIYPMLLWNAILMIFSTK